MNFQLRIFKKDRLVASFLQCMTIYLFAIQTSHAGTPVPAQPSTPERVVQVRGKESIIQELNLGPESTELWRKIQILISNFDDIQDFSKLVELFGLTVTDPIDHVSIKKPGTQYRTDAKDERYLKLRMFGYAITTDAKEPKRRVVKLNINFFPRVICISNSEIRRVYGKGEIAIGGHGNILPAFYVDPTGITHSEGYGRSSSNDGLVPLIFTYTDSGCVEGIYLQQVVSE